ncbi:hypothetical protein EDD16DRAFT_1702695 [Pisolithus croceorrhizus]|nr:hypothetical protein EV401DRAFT_2079308 [Pisolithus croceorrhizus]KAI6126347.1 hypothetical protein EDD16DRAFT_1702695 [Pisolithus croceorrhizus]
MTWNGRARQKTIVPHPFSLDSHSRAQRMAAIGKLYTLPGIKATNAIAGVKLEEPVYKHYEDDEMPEFPSKFPCGRIPAFEVAEGFNLTESAAIARYIASVATNSGLPGGTVEGTALINQYIHAALGESQLHGFSTPEAILLTRIYLVDERLTLANIAVASVIFLSVSHTLDALLHNMYPNVLRHLDLIIDQPKLKDVFGHPTFVEKAVQYTPPAKEKKEKELKQPAPAPALKKEKPKKAEEDDEEDENPNPKIPLISYQIDAQSRGLETHFNKNMRGLGDSLESFYEKTSSPLTESYDYKKLDLENSEDKAFCRGALAWDLEIDGKKWRDRRNFK